MARNGHFFGGPCRKPHILMTKDHFERRYAERSGITVEQLRALGRIVVTCDCGEPSCEGWQSVNGDGDDWAADAKIRSRPAEH